MGMDGCLGGSIHYKLHAARYTAHTTHCTTTPLHHYPLPTTHYPLHEKVQKIEVQDLVGLLQHVLTEVGFADFTRLMDSHMSGYEPPKFGSQGGYPVYGLVNYA